MSESVPGPVPQRPAICLNMIVRNEAHIIGETLDSVAPYISSWVIVDTGSTDGTQDLIVGHMARLSIPGELHERPWRTFGHNRTEALTLAQGHGDYIWVMDADDTVVGTPDFSRLDADVYFMRISEQPYTYWRAQLFRDGRQVHYEGVVHEYANWDDAYLARRLDSDCHIESRRLGARNLDPAKYARDRDLLLAQIARDPADARSVFYLAQTYFCLGDFASARQWDTRRAHMGGWDEAVYFSLWRIGQAMAHLGAPWPDVQDAYLRAWDFRPTRAEPLYDIALHYRDTQNHQLGYLFAERAAHIPFPADDILFVRADVYAWRATDEQALFAFRTGRHAEACTLWHRLLAQPNVPEEERQRFAGNRDICAPMVLAAATAHPDAR